MRAPTSPALLGDGLAVRVMAVVAAVTEAVESVEMNCRREL